MKTLLNGALALSALLSFASIESLAAGGAADRGPTVRDHRTVKPMKPFCPMPVGVMVTPKPIGIMVPKPMPIGIKPIGIIKPPGIVKPPFPVGIVKPPVGIVKPPVVGIVKPPFPIGIVKPPVVGVKPPVVGIIKPPIGIVKPPVIGIVKPPVIGIVKPPVIGIIKPPVKPPVIIGIVKPPKPPIVIGIIVQPPHYPHYPKWPHWPHCPRRPYPGGVYYPIYVGQPYPVTVPVTQGVNVYNLQCALPEGAQAQGLTSVNVNLMETADGNFQVFGVFLDENKEEANLNVMARGTLGNDVNLSLDGSDEILLQKMQDQAGNQFLAGKVTLKGHADQNGLACALSLVQQQQ